MVSRSPSSGIALAVWLRQLARRRHRIQYVTYMYIPQMTPLFHRLVILCIVEAIEISFVCSGDWRSDYRSNLGGDPINTN